MHISLNSGIQRRALVSHDLKAVTKNFISIGFSGILVSHGLSTDS